MKKVAFITTSSSSVLNFRAELIEALLGKPVEIHVIAPDFDQATKSDLRKMSVIPHDCKFSRTGLNPFDNLLGIVRMYRVLAMVKPDILFCYFAKAVIFGTLVGYLLRVERRVAMIEGLGSMYVDQAVTFKRRLVRKLMNVLYGFSLKRSHATVFLNQQDEADFRRMGLLSGVTVRQLGGIGIDLDKWRPVKGTDRPTTFMLAARMLRQKGVVEFCEAAKLVKEQHPEARFVLLGDVDSNPDSLTPDEINQWVSRGIVEWPGFVDPAVWLKECDVFVLPSYYREGVPRSSQEALAMGLPLITTDNVGCRETVDDGVNGFLVPIQDTRTLAERMIRFIQNPGLAYEMGKRSRRLAEAKFNVKEKVRIQLDILGV